MSCNPAIGGLGKGHLVREIDALDGLMARAADAAGIQFRVLNRRKGPAVQGPRAQADRTLYRRAMQAADRRDAGLTVVEGEAAELPVAKPARRGVALADGRASRCRAVVVTTGTFLRGVIHLGRDPHPRRPVRRVRPSIALAQSLEAAGFRLGTAEDRHAAAARRDDDRLGCAGGPARRRAAGVLFALTRKAPAAPQLPCHITRTTAETTAIVRADSHRSAVYSGAISGRGPRYCPSIEDKVVRFADRDSHQIFLEPEGVDDPLVYPNGISTSLPAETQRALIATIPGLERARIVRPGYAIEYDYIDPRGLDPTLEARRLPGSVPRRADQRHDRLRGGGGARVWSPGSTPPGGPEPSVARDVRPRQFLSRRHDRRPDDPRRQRALSHVHLARRVSAVAAGRQCRRAADRARAWRSAASATSGRRRSRQTREQLARARGDAEGGDRDAACRSRRTGSRSIRTASAARPSSSRPSRSFRSPRSRASGRNSPTIPAGLVARARGRREIRRLSRPAGRRRRPLPARGSHGPAGRSRLRPHLRPFQRIASRSSSPSAPAASARPAASRG